MSAGGISYSGLTNYGRATLPSVDTWGTNMNILKDPPKSITTRKINKVGENSSITQMIDDSSDRACEAIQVFARGVNPSVSVSYSNYGNNGGSGQSGSLTGLSNPIAGAGRQAKLPYTILRDGAFRPPVRRQEDLLPLSRLPRVWTSAFSKPGFADYSRKARTCATADKTYEVKTTRLKACVRPTATYKIEKPQEKPREVDHIIQPVLKKAATSGVRTMDITQRTVKKPTKEIDVSPLHARAQANQADPTKYVNNSEMNTEPYVQNVNTANVVSNRSTNKHQTNIKDILDLSDMHVKDIRTFSREAPKNRGEKTDYIHGELLLDRNLPEHQSLTNKTNSTKYVRKQHTNKIEFDRNIPSSNFSSVVVEKGSSDHGSRTMKLIPKISAGGFDNTGQRPSIHRDRVIQSHETQKAKTSRLVMESMQGRFDKPAPWSR